MVPKKKSGTSQVPLTQPRWRAGYERQPRRPQYGQSSRATGFSVLIFQLTYLRLE